MLIKSRYLLIKPISLPKEILYKIFDKKFLSEMTFFTSLQSPDYIITFYFFFYIERF